MAKQVAQDGQLDVSDSYLTRGSTQPMPAASAAHAASVTQTYQPTGIVIFDRGLDIVDSVTGGKAGVFQRLCTYLVFGGFAAVVNLTIFWVLFYKSTWPQDDNVRKIVAQAAAYEISILANFIPNDYFTFRHMAGHTRSWNARAVRFHITSVSGIIVTALIFTLFNVVFGVEALVAQAIALVLATAYNFTVHHLFTYRHTAEAH